MEIAGVPSKGFSVFDPARSIFQSAPLLALVTFIPSWLITRATVYIVEYFGYVSSNLLPAFELDGFMLVVAVLLGPLLETFALAVGMWAMCRFVRRPWVASIASGLIWATIHGFQAPLWALGTFWPFIVFSRAYLAWRPRGRSDAIGVAWLAHSIHNAFAVCVSYVL